jgi:PAS domain S-box-containing protein
MNGPRRPDEEIDPLCEQCVMGLRIKLTIFALVVGLLIGAAPLVQSIAHERAVVIGETQARGVLIASQLQDTLSRLHGELGSIADARSIQEAKSKVGVIAAYAMDSDGRIVSDGTSRTYTDEARIPQFDAVIGEVKQSTGWVARQDGELLRISGRVESDGQPVGFIHLVLSMQSASDIAQAHLALLGKTYGVVLPVAILIALLAAHLLSQPVRWMLTGLQAMQKGNFKIKIPVRSGDELGQLGAALNQIAGSLRATTVSKRYLDEILQSMADSLIVVDTSAIIITVNRATLDMLNYDEKALVSQPASLVCIDAGYELTGPRLNHLLGQCTQQDHEMMYRTSTGRMIPVSFSGSPIRDNAGEVIGYVCIGKDISERKKNEQEREKLNKQLVATSRQAGMAEVAIGVLHNVGNVLNSINMSASLVSDKVRKSKVSGLVKVVDLLHTRRDALAEFLTGDEKGRQLPSYLGQLAQHLAEEQTSILQEITSLTQNINHIKDIITMQQSYSKVTGVIETVSLKEVIEEALRLNEVSLERHQVRVERQYDEIPPIKTDKHKLLQILVNLITNAKDAVDSVDPDRKRIIARLGLDPADPAKVSIQVVDYGEGIASDNMTKIFNHGFTTKKKGHGFGLHSAALTAKELKGSLVATSEGPGKGATFTITLPLESEVAHR